MAPMPPPGYATVLCAKYRDYIVRRFDLSEIIFKIHIVLDVEFIHKGIQLHFRYNNYIDMTLKLSI